jgi:hypothetical protein
MAFSGELKCSPAMSAALAAKSAPALARPILFS